MSEIRSDGSGAIISLVNCFVIRNGESLTTFDDGNKQSPSAFAKTIDEARRLVESGFTFVCDMEGTRLFSKRK